MGPLRRQVRPPLTLALALAATLLKAPLAAQQGAVEDARPVTAEYAVKAAFLYNFLKYVEWPRRSSQEPLLLCVAGQNPFGSELEQLLEGERIDGREVRTKVILEPDSSCHAVFMPEGSNRGVYLRAAAKQPVLTIGESPDFLAEGGIINFVLDGARVRFVIDAEAAARENLRISSRLLRLAMAPPPRGTK